MAHYVGDDCPGGHSEESEKGFKFDSEKLRYDLIPPFPLSQLAQVYTDGAKKYGDFNYLQGMSFRRILAALMRHTEAYRAGETIDPESGLPHMAHAAWQCFALMVYEHEGLGADDRVYAPRPSGPCPRCKSALHVSCFPIPNITTSEEEKINGS